MKDKIIEITNKLNVIVNTNNYNVPLLYYKDYNVNGLNFKIILQDLYINRNNQILTIKNINAYFVDKNKYVYLISLASGPYLFNESKQLKNIKNIKEDIVYS